MRNDKLERHKPRSRKDNWGGRPRLILFLSFITLVGLLSFGTRTALDQTSDPDESIQVQGSMSLRNGKQVSLGVPFEVVVSITASGDNPQLEVNPPQITWHSDLVLDPRKSSQESHSRSKNGTQITVRSFIYSLKAKGQPNSIVIGAFPVSYRVRGLSEERVLIIPGMSFDVVQAQPSKGMNMKFFSVFAVAFALAAAVAALTAAKRRRSSMDNSNPLQKSSSSESVEETLEGCFLKELASAQKRWLAGEDREYFAEVESHLREYIQGKYPVRLRDNPERDMESLCSSGVDRKRASRLVSLLGMCRDARYSPQVPSGPEQNRFQRELEEVVRSSR